MLSSTISGWLFLGIVNLFPYVAGQGQVTTTATCTTDLWTRNQEGQSPCLVTSALQAACDGGNFNVPALEPGQIYFGPEFGFGNPCTCSSVTYSMAMACGACQGAGINKWSTWKTNCSVDQISVAVFPLGIPSSVTIPAWAYQNVTILDLWDANQALATANDNVPDSSAIPQPTDTPNNTSTTSKSKTNIAAIAGGAAGGVVLIILIVLAIFFWRRRTKKNGNNSSKAALVKSWLPNEQEKFIQSGNGSNNNNDIALSSYHDTSPLPSPEPPAQTVVSPMGTVSQASPPHQQFRPYDPSDPSTFPTTPASFSAMPSSPTASDQTFQLVQQSQPPLSNNSVRSLPTQRVSYPHESTQPVPGLIPMSYAVGTGTGPNIQVGMSMPASYAVQSSTGSGQTVYTTVNQGHLQSQPNPAAALNSSQYIVSNPSYGPIQLQVPYGQQPPRRTGGYTGVAEI